MYRLGRLLKFKIPCKIRRFTITNGRRSCEIVNKCMKIKIKQINCVKELNTNRLLRKNVTEVIFKRNASYHSPTKRNLFLFNFNIF